MRYIATITSLCSCSCRLIDRHYAASKSRIEVNLPDIQSLHVSDVRCSFYNPDRKVPDAARCRCGQITPRGPVLKLISITIIDQCEGQSQPITPVSTVIVRWLPLGSHAPFSHRAATTGSIGFISLLLHPPEGVATKPRLNTGDRVGK